MRFKVRLAICTVLARTVPVFAEKFMDSQIVEN